MTPGRTPEGYVLSRRHFLKLAAASAAAALGPVFLALAPAAAAGPGSARAIDMPDGNRLRSAGIVPGPTTGIVQTGMTEIEVESRMYKPVVRPDVFLELIRAVALTTRGEAAQQQVDNWLQKNVLEVEIFAPGVMDFNRGGYFKPPDDGRPPAIKFRSDFVAALNFPDRDTSLTVSLMRLTRDDLRVTPVHETRHFVDFVNFPERYRLNYKSAVKNLLDCLNPFMAVSLSIGLNRTRLLQMIHRDKLFKRTATYAGMVTGISKLFNWGIQASGIDTSHDGSYQNEAIRRLIEDHPALGILAVSAITLTEKETANVPAVPASIAAYG